MNPFVVHIASGLSLFTGGIAVILSLSLLDRFPPPWINRLLRVLVIAGISIAILSATALPLWFTATASSITLASLSSRLTRRWPVLRKCVCLLWATVCMLELPRLITPQIDPSVNVETVVVLADSVTAGLGEEEATTWPALLRVRQNVNVIDLSHVGETTRTGHQRAAQHGLPADCVVLIELGGNDILGSTSSEDFAKELDSLLRFATAHQRHVFLFELPLPPFHNDWGSIQRTLARKYDVNLIPRHRLASVFQGKESTMDSIHLSQSGHERMLTIVCEVLRIPTSTD